MTNKTPLLLSILAGAFSSRKGNVVPCFLNGLSFNTLLDTKASDNFVDEKVAKYQGLKPRCGTSTVSMASGKLNAPILEKFHAILSSRKKVLCCNSRRCTSPLFRYRAKTILYEQAQKNYFQIK